MHENVYYTRSVGTKHQLNRHINNRTGGQDLNYKQANEYKFKMQKL